MRVRNIRGVDILFYIVSFWNYFRPHNQNLLLYIYIYLKLYERKSLVSWTLIRFQLLSLYSMIGKHEVLQGKRKRYERKNTLFLCHLSMSRIVPLCKALL